MENFTNETLDTTQLPKFEEVQFSLLHPNYWKVTVISLSIFFIILGTGAGMALYSIEELSGSYSVIITIYIVLIVFAFGLSRISYRKKGFAFRNHDVLFRSGIISTNTIVIPYNRVQHVALHEGLVSRYFGLAKIEIFTAGGSSSDIEIPGIEKSQAENIKQLLMGKIQKQL
ncbi:PH domain-containing protein [Flavobacterium sp. GT3R68]|uniref:PH domain-containing protein n=1 Tax=Flavobacterium sp. GT3R68 TaxID=2594437 RepID=UPI000F899909|nr:PH domain-containing protein [Flavobacterium sp. GT3R68]RTY95008.1 PH domain-containing protein [Flavobacterium sp. GSN2]TRW91813.1 PH domain-containing protein [Flavobacterium sp. GT3R68]